MKKLLLLLLLVTTISSAQRKKSAKMGQIHLTELHQKIYGKDSSAIAVVLFEQGNTYINSNKNYDFTTDYYFRIKILKKEGFEKSIIKIPTYKKETVDKIKGITYNLEDDLGMQKTVLQKKDIFRNKDARFP